MTCYCCNICLGGSFDMCKKRCVQQGIHCQDNKQFLEERTLDTGVIMNIARHHFKRMASGESNETMVQL